VDLAVELQILSFHQARRASGDESLPAAVHVPSGTVASADHETIGDKRDRDKRGDAMRIEDHRAGRSRREATAAERRGIAAHIEEYPECDGSRIVDNHDQTLLTAKPFLWCEDCEVRVYPT
jgi:hypothetical protein